MIHTACTVHIMSTAHQPRTGPVVGVLAFAGIVVALMQTLVVPLIPQLPTLLHASASNASWAITATLLAGAIATPVLGRLGDMYGKRRMLLVSLALLVAGSVVCALADSLTPMVIGRVLQGCAMGVIPLGISIMRDELPPEKLGSSMALMSSSLGVGGAFGLPGAAAIAEHASWHILFWVSGGVGAVAIGLVLLVVPESPLRGGGHFDLPGAAGLSAGLLSLLLAISKGADWGWGSGTTLGFFGAAVVILLVWGRWELRTAEPLVDLRTTAKRPVLLTNLASIVVGFALYSMSLVLPQLLELPKATGYGLGQSMLAAGLVMGPSGLVMMAVSPISARVSAARGPKVSLMIGAVIMGAGYGFGVLLMDAVWQLLVVSSVIGAGIAFAYASMPALIMSSVPPSETAAANGLNALMRSIGTSSSSAVVGVVLAHMTTTFGTTTLPSESGFRTALIIGGAAAVMALAITAFIPGRRQPTLSAAGDPAATAQVPDHSPAT
ncbi:MAG: major facilitator superfamily 1 [Streptomyces oryziradicis]|nr:major facilitator superfamily 1 [Actinacidiphila oryziradicis]